MSNFKADNMDLVLLGIGLVAFAIGAVMDDAVSMAASVIPLLTGYIGLRADKLEQLIEAKHPAEED